MGQNVPAERLGLHQTLSVFQLLAEEHDHNYQRFRPERGLTQFVVGTGGRSLYATDRSDPRLASVDDVNFGAFELSLGVGRATYRFMRSGGATGDAGSLDCRAHSLKHVGQSPSSAYGVS